jgi:hypothetical protein
VGRLGRKADAPYKPALQATEWLYLKRRNLSIPITHDYAEQVIQECATRNIPPESFIMDSTGNAIGLRDVLQVEWSNRLKRRVLFRAVCFAAAPTESKILDEDSRACGERFDRLVTELCTASMEWARAGCLAIAPTPPPDLRLQLEARLGGLSKRKNTYGELLRRAETKEEMRKRGYHSPDEFDALNLLVHLARMKNPANAASNLSLSTYTSLTAAGLAKHLRLRGKSALPSSVEDEVLQAVRMRERGERKESPAAKMPEYGNAWSDADAENKR